MSLSKHITNIWNGANDLFCTMLTFSWMCVSIMKEKKKNDIWSYFHNTTIRLTDINWDRWRKLDRTCCSQLYVESTVQIYICCTELRLYQKWNRLFMSHFYSSSAQILSDPHLQFKGRELENPNASASFSSAAYRWGDYFILKREGHKLNMLIFAWRGKFILNLKVLIQS